MRQPPNTLKTGSLGKTQTPINVTSTDQKPSSDRLIFQCLGPSAYWLLESGPGALQDWAWCLLYEGVFPEPTVNPSPAMWRFSAQPSHLLGTWASGDTGSLFLALWGYVLKWNEGERTQGLSKPLQIRTGETLWERQTKTTKLGIVHISESLFYSRVLLSLPRPFKEGIK